MPPALNVNGNEENEAEIAEFLQAVNKKDFERVICKIVHNKYSYIILLCMCPKY